MKELSGFRVLPLKLRGGASATHSLFAKRHDVRERSESKPSGRTLFVLNVPPFLNENLLKEAFGVAGKVDAVELNDRPTAADSESDRLFFKNEQKTGFKVAHVVYRGEADLKKALQIPTLDLNYDSLKSVNGVSKWIADYNSAVPDPKRLKAEIDEHMNDYDRRTAEKAEREKASAEADGEGWTTVTKQGRKPGFERKESVVNKIAATKAAGQKKKELKNFYTFQIRESKMNHIVALRKKFEEDKKKVAALKQSRRFKPF